MNQEIVKDVGGTLVYDAQLGRPSAATASINKPGGTEIATPTVTIDTCNTNVSVTIAAPASTIRVDSATGIAVRRRYLVTNNVGQSEWVRVKSINDTDVTTYEPTAYDHDSNSTFVGTRCTVPVSSGNADTLAEGYELRLTLTIGGANYYPIEQYDVVRSVWPTPLMAQWEFTREAGDLGRDIAATSEYAGEDFFDEIEIATAAVKTDILARGLHHTRFRSHFEFKPVVVWKVIQRWARLGENVPAAWLQEGMQAYQDHVDTQYNRALTTALATARSYDEDESGAVDDSERVRKLDVKRLIR